MSLIIISSISGISSAHAIQADAIPNTDKYYQGDNGNISVTLNNDNPLVPWYIQTITIQFDWAPYSITINRYIASGGSGTFNIPFNIPQTTSVGWHQYTIEYLGAINDLNILRTKNINVHDFNERVYLNLENEVQNDFTNTNSNYQSPAARSDFSQARSHFSQATSYASQSQFLNAISELNSAKSALNQAVSDEQAYIASQAAANTNQGYSGGNSGYSGGSGGYSPPVDYNIIFIIGIVMIAAVSGAIIFFIKKRKNVKSAPKSGKKKTLPKKINKWWNSPMRKTAKKSKIISDDTQFYACPHCGGDISTKNNKQFCNSCNQHI